MFHEEVEMTYMKNDLTMMMFHLSKLWLLISVHSDKSLIWLIQKPISKLGLSTFLQIASHQPSRCLILRFVGKGMEDDLKSWAMVKESFLLSPNSITYFDILVLDA